MINKYNVSKPEKYTNKQGEEKTMWHNIGTMTIFTKEDGTQSRILEIPAKGRTRINRTNSSKRTSY